MGILRPTGSLIERWTKSTYDHTALYEDVERINVYRYYKDNLRPWDRALPAFLQFEGMKRNVWRTSPPTLKTILGVLLAALVAYALLALLPLYVNRTLIEQTWRDIQKPSKVITNATVLLAMWVVSHGASAFSLWFVYLSEGFGKHVIPMTTFGIAFFAECPWMDLLFDTYRLDWVTGCWATVLTFTLITMYLMRLEGMNVAALFLIPQVCCCCLVIVFCVEFMQIYGIKYYLSKPIDSKT